MTPYFPTRRPSDLSIEWSTVNGSVPTAVTTPIRGLTVARERSHPDRPAPSSTTQKSSLGCVARTAAMTYSNRFACLGGRVRPAVSSTAAASRLVVVFPALPVTRSEEHTSELQSLMRTSYAVFCLQKKTKETN